jgi:hypothetical protein
MRATRWLALLPIFTSVHFFSGTAGAIDASNVLVLYNLASPEGQEIANYYASAHPGVQLLGLSGLTTSEYITADAYLSTLRPQVLSALTPATDVIVTTKGMPLRVHVTEPQPPAQFPNLPQYTDPWGQTREILSWKPYSSLESELAAIDTISMWQMMGDQSWNYPPAGSHFTANPYYQSTTSFSHVQYGTRLTARLDGYTYIDDQGDVDLRDITGAIDNAQQAFIGPTNTPGGPMHFLVDNDPTRPYSLTMTRLVNDVLTPAGMPLTYNNTTAFVGTTPGPLIGFDSHGDHQVATPSNYINYITNVLDQTLADGAVFTSIESFNAYSFNVGGYTGSQGQIAQWLAAGGTAGVGTVEEPVASWATLTNEDWLFKNLLAGMTLAEAAWSANCQLSFVNTLVGDPLMTWRMLNPADINRDGLVDISDLSIMGAHWGEAMQPGGYGWGIADLNSDGLVDISDLSIMGAHWGESSPWADGSADMQGISATELSATLQTMIADVPEPSSVLLLGLGVTAMIAYRPWAKRRYRRVAA